MKPILLMIVPLVGLLSCKNEPTTSSFSIETTKEDRSYPEAIQHVFAAHGGLKKWNRVQILSLILAFNSFLYEETSALNYHVIEHPSILIFC